MCAVTSSRRSSGVTALHREALDDGERAVADRDREGEGALEADLARPPARGKLGSHVTSTIQAGGRWRRRGPAGRCRWRARCTRSGLEGFELGRVAEVPDVRRLSAGHASSGRTCRHGRRASRSSGRRARRRLDGVVDVSTLAVAAATASIRATNAESVANCAGGSGRRGDAGGSASRMRAGRYRGRRCGRGAAAHERGDLGEGRLLGGSGHCAPVIGHDVG